MLQHIQHQADQAEQGQDQADSRNGLHQHDGGVHLICAGLIEGIPPINHLVQISHQGGQVRLDVLLINSSGPGWRWSASYSARNRQTHEAPYAAAP